MDVADFLNFMFRYVWVGWPIWLPVFVGMVAWQFWFFYVRQEYHRNLKWTHLYIKIPKTMVRSPQAMELILNALYQSGGTGTWHQRWWQGKMRAYHSLEIISVEGKIYYVIRTEQRFANLLKSYIYSQYPQAEITEADDYTKYVIPPDEKGSEFKATGTEYVLKKDDFLPIPTYIDFGLDKVTKPEDRELAVDPMAPMLEYMGSLGPGEQLWLQIIIRPDSNRYAKEGGVDLRQGWKDEFKKGYEKAAKALLKDPLNKDNTLARTAISDVNRRALESLERNSQKFGFDTTMRIAYVHNNEKMRGDVPMFMGGMFRQFESVNSELNTFRPHNNTFGAANPWDDTWSFFHGGKTFKDKREGFFKKYVHRAGFFHPAINDKMFILTTEELATIFHFPGEQIQTPSYERVQNKKAEPPANLPNV